MESKKLSIAVIGAGRLGMPLCEHLIAAGHEVQATINSPIKLGSSNNKLDLTLFDIKSQTLSPQLLLKDVIIYTIPPLGIGEVKKLFEIVDSNKKIIFLSSISVYGKKAGTINEESSLSPETTNAHFLKESEDFLRTHFNQLTILRLGGLYSETFHPIYSLAGKKKLVNGEELLHLVHLLDCVEAIHRVIEKDIWSETLNLVDDLRIPKKDFYPKEARRLGLLIPQYEEISLENPTNISNEKSKRILSLSYRKKIP